MIPTTVGTVIVVVGGCNSVVVVFVVGVFIKKNTILVVAIAVDVLYKNCV
jgi:hypothetical protein